MFDFTLIKCTPTKTLYGQRNVRKNLLVTCRYNAHLHGLLHKANFNLKITSSGKHKNPLQAMENYGYVGATAAKRTYSYAHWDGRA